MKEVVRLVELGEEEELQAELGMLVARQVEPCMYKVRQVARLVVPDMYKVLQEARLAVHHVELMDISKDTVEVVLD